MKENKIKEELYGYALKQHGPSPQTKSGIPFKGGGGCTQGTILLIAVT